MVTNDKERSEYPLPLEKPTLFAEGEKNKRRVLIC